MDGGWGVEGGKGRPLAQGSWAVLSLTWGRETYFPFFSNLKGSLKQLSWGLEDQKRARERI